MTSPSCFQSPPVDVLKQIFEFIVEPIEASRGEYRATLKKLKQSTHLASVSRDWRTGALQTPRLWNNILVSLDWDPDMVKEYWTSMIQRVKGIPVSLSMCDMCEESRIRLEDLDGSSMMFRRITLDLTHHGDVATIPESWCGYDVDTLVLAFRCPNPDPNDPHTSVTPIDVRRFIRNVRRFELISFEPTQANITGVPNSHLLELHLCFIQDINMGDVIQCFPQLESLHLRACDIKSLSSAPITTEIQFLDLWDQSHIEWLPTFKFPKIRRVAYRDLNIRDFDDFLTVNSTIETIKLGVSYDATIRNLPDVASQITNLHIVLFWANLWWGDYIASPEAFPALKILGITRSLGSIDPSQLNAVIRARCLPMNHPLSKATNPSRLLEEFFIEISETYQCEGIKLYTQATKRTVNAGSLKRQYLSWSAE